MPKNKKAKTSHAGGLNGIGTKGDLTHDEIWDDTALVRSWEAAVEEYKYYHSLAAQGLDVETILEEAEAAEANGRPLPLGLDGVARRTIAETAPLDGVTQSHESAKSEAEEGEVEDTDVRPPTAEERDAALRRAGLDVGPSSTETNRATTDSLPKMRVQQHESSQSAQPAPNEANEGLQEQTLENLKMAYYWAGYYSGLYDGQRQSETKPAS